MATLLLLYILQNNFFLVAQQPYLGLGHFSVEVLKSHIVRHIALSTTPLDKGLACPRDLYLTSFNTHKRQTSMPPAGFEPTVPASEWP
jgi:hypothetical protein